MGMLRALLALSVVFAHAGSFNLIGGRNAVQIFYIISGFLISYVITERKNFHSKIDFYISRYFRLFPQYIIIAIATLASYAAIPDIGNRFFWSIDNLVPFQSAIIMISNVIIIDQDWLMFTHIDSHHLTFSANFRDHSNPTYHALLLPQSWTLGVELSFYFIAPFILKNRNVMLILACASLLVRVYIFKQGLGTVDPWSYRFFPAELFLFLAGSLAHQIGLPLYQKFCSNIINAALTYLIIITICFYYFFPLPELVKTALLFSAVLFALPAMFIFQHRRSWDAKLGELSYPIYINHILIIILVSSTGLVPNGPVFTICVVVLSIGLSLIMNRWIGKPVDRWRRRFGTQAPRPDTLPSPIDIENAKEI